MTQEVWHNMVINHFCISLDGSQEWEEEFERYKQFPEYQMYSFIFSFGEASHLKFAHVQCAARHDPA